jgi:hypothetical protein
MESEELDGWGWQSIDRIEGMVMSESNGVINVREGEWLKWDREETYSVAI